MKKLLVLLLVLAMVLPMGISAASAEGENIRPFVMVNWGGVKEGKYDYVWSAPYFWTNRNAVLDPIEISAFDTVNPKKMAERMKVLMDARPDGARHINFNPLGAIFSHYAEHNVYLDKGAEEIREWLEEFIPYYHEIGGKIDGFVIDVEYVHGGAYYVNMAANNNLMLYKEIVDDPRYATQMRPLLEAQGFPFYENISDYTPEIYSIAESGDASRVWNTVIGMMQTNYINYAVSEVLWQYYPDAIVSDYQRPDFKGWFRSTTNNSGNGYRVGNSSNENMYFIRPNAEFYEVSSQPVFKSPDSSYVKAYYDQTPFNQALYEANLFKNIYASTDSGKLTAWIPYYDYGTNSKDHAFYDRSASNTAYYSEIVYHIGLLDPHPFLGYIYEGDVEAFGDGDYETKLVVANQVLGELTRLVGAADRVPILIPATWNSSYILSGMYAGGRNIWRITPDTDLVSVADFKIEGADPTFRINGQTITFPGGKIIEDGKIDEVGSCGYWVETATDVYPIVTSDADRYQQLPAIDINFDSWKLGAFDFNVAYPKGGWELKKGDAASSLEVVENNGSNAMAFNGSITLTNAKMPANVNAGDSYPKKQVWDVTVTVPEGLSNDAEVVLLSYAGAKQSAKDGGFKIAGGKLYYGVTGEKDAAYEELMSISAGTYTLRREMNFTTEGAFTCDYYVFDAEGKELKNAKGAAIPAFTTPVNNIAFQTVNADKAVIIDDYKILLNSVYADLTLYQESNGMQIKDQSVAQTENTAYRLSWLNATDAEAKAQVIAAVYEGEKLISETVVKEITMLPGYDNIETGIVEVAEGQSVKVYLKTSGEDSASGGGMNTTLLIVVIAAVVVVAAAVVVALVVVKKNNTTEDDETEEETEETEETEE